MNLLLQSRSIVSIFLLALLLAPLHSTASGVDSNDLGVDNPDMEGEAQVESPHIAACGGKPIALLSSPSRIDALVTWLSNNSGFTEGCSFLATGEVIQLLKWNLFTRSLGLEALPDITKGGDIHLAQQVLEGNVGGVIFFHDPLSTTPDLSLFVRACDVAKVPLALNEATADLALRGLAKTRSAYLIFNPVAGQGDSTEELALIRSTLDPILDLTVVMTQPDREAAEQAEEIVNMIKARPASESGSPAIIIASGGDGTVSAVAGATINTGIPFGVIPRGTANAFSVALGIPTDVRAACRNIIAGHVRVVDAARCNDTPMILLGGIGFEAGMVDNATRELKDKIGTLAYVLGGAQQFFSKDTFKCTLKVDGQESELSEVGAVTVANVAPATSVLAQGFGEVVPDDGLLDVTIATPSNMVQAVDALASLVASAVVKVPTQTDSLLCIRAKTVEISCDPKHKLVIDGEMLEMDPMKFTVVPQGLKVIAPPAVA